MEHITWSLGSQWMVQWLITMVIVSPLPRVAPFPNGLFMAYKWGDPITTYVGLDWTPFIHGRFMACKWGLLTGF